MYGGVGGEGPRGFPLSRFPEDAQLRRPIRKSQAQPTEIGIAREDFGFDGRDLAAAANNSRRLLPPFLRHFIERPAIDVELCLPVGQCLPALHHNINVLRIELNPVTDALRQFCRRERCAGTKERVINEFAAPKVVENRAPH